ncbi:MAG TPA: hypothetical protein VMY39_04360 [Planctomycetota bacterium]|nr:hypothetical protein [Planctomycetota bacterium]
MKRFAVLAGVLLVSSAVFAQGMEPIPFTNPKGQEPADIVKEVMRKYGIEEAEPAFIETGTWVYASETSAIVAMESNVRTQAVLHYTEGRVFDKSLQDKELHYIHVFYLTGLKPDTEYAWEMGLTDKRHRGVDSGRRTFTTRSMKDVVRIPDDLEGPPYELNGAGKTYLVTKDITAHGTAFNISASDVTLDLGGHTVVYNDEAMKLPTDSFNRMVKESAFGVRARGADRNVKILNGTLRQGRGNDEGSYTSIGFNPIYLSGGAGSEIAGVTCVYGGRQLSGIVLHWAGRDITVHHCVIEDTGKLIANRHQQLKAIAFDCPSGGKVYNNLVKRTRHVGIGGGAVNAEIAHNEIHVDSSGINGGGVGAKADSDIHHNRVFGCGDNVVGFATTGGKTSANVRIHDNYVWLHAHDISEYKAFLNTKEMESSEYSIMSATRITWGCENPQYYNNVILVTARDGGKVRGTFFYADPSANGASFRDNLVIALCENDRSDGWGAIGGVGTRGRGEPQHILFQNNTLVSNFANFSLKDSYGTAQNYRFVGNTFVKVGDRADYATIVGRPGYVSSGHVFLDTRFEGGAGFDQLRGLNQDDFTVQWTLTVEAPAGAKIAIKDADDKEVFTGTVDVGGKLDVPLTEFTFKALKKTLTTPHTVTVTAAGRVTVHKVTMDAAKTLKVD